LLGGFKNQQQRVFAFMRHDLKAHGSILDFLHFVNELNRHEFIPKKIRIYKSISYFTIINPSGLTMYN